VTWPPDKPPTLDEMDRNMKVWAAAKDEHERMVHKGRVQEAALLQDKMAQLKYKAAEAGHAKKFLEGEVVRLEARREIDVENLHRVSAELARRNSALRTCEAENKRLAGLVQKQDQELAAMSSRTSALEKELRAQHVALAQAGQHFANEALQADARLAEAMRRAEGDKEKLRARVEEDALRSQGQTDAAAAAERARRVDLHGLRILRRILNRVVSLAFNAWCTALQDAKEARREAAAAAVLAERDKTVDAIGRDVEGLKAKLAESEQSMAKWQADAEAAKEANAAMQAALDAAKEESARALDRLRIDHEAEARSWNAGAEERERATMEAVTAAEEKLAAERAARIQQVGGQLVRRIMNRDASLGFTAWLAYAVAHRDAKEKLREVANRFRAPDKSLAFGAWADDVRETKRAEQDRLGKAAKAARERNIAQLYLRLQESEAEVAKLRRRERETLAPTNRYSKAARIKRSQEVENDKRRRDAGAAEAADPDADR